MPVNGSEVMLDPENLLLLLFPGFQFGVCFSSIISANINRAYFLLPENCSSILSLPDESCSFPKNHRLT